MKKFIFFIAVIVFNTTINAQNDSPWKRINQNNDISDRNNTPNNDNQLLFKLDEAALKQSLRSLQNKTAKGNRIEITIPNGNGVLEKFSVWESSNFEPELQSKYPDIRAYNGIGITDRNASLYFSLSPKGIQTMVLRGGSGSEFIEPYSKDNTQYVVFNSKNRVRGSLPFTCKTDDVVLNKKLLDKTSKIAANNQVFKTMRLALSCTGEYTTYHRTIKTNATGTQADALAAMNNTMTRVNGVFNKDLALKLIIIANNNAVIYTDATTDPYSPANVGTEGDNPPWSKELQDNLTATIGAGNYDIGHLFGASGGGGNAGCIGCVCDDAEKGSAFTSPSDGKPEGDAFDIDFVAHEMGHQLGATHTFSYSIEGTDTNVEPGSGSTIMGYAGITDYDVQPLSDDYFAYVSIKQIQDNLAPKTCPTSTVITNSPPAINAGPDFTIPKGTAFKLTGTGSDINGDTITYCWEQNNTAISTSGANSVPSPTKPDGPLFRSIYPSSSPIRYMPAYNTVLAGSLSNSWESVASIARTLNFTLTGRDNAAQGTAQTNTDDMVVNVSGTVGPFEVTSQNTDNIGWMIGSTQNITWSVNGSNGLGGSVNVNIKLSTDGGLTFPTILATNTPNDGSETILVPNAAATNCRILIEPTANIYYAINSKPFAIGYSVVSSCDSFNFISSPTPITEQEAYTTKTITYPVSAGSISDVNFALNFSHGYLEDLEIEVISPQGTTVKLFNQSCGDTNSSLILNYDDIGGPLACSKTTAQTVAPFQPLSAFNGQNPQGVWTLRYRDAWQGDTGTINSASISICAKTFTPMGIADFKMEDFVLYPNPNKGNFNLKYTSDSTNVIKVIINDLSGRQIFAKEYGMQKNFSENIQMQNVQAGIYILTLIDGKRKEVRKFAIK